MHIKCFKTSKSQKKKTRFKCDWLPKLNLHKIIMIMKACLGHTSLPLEVVSPHIAGGGRTTKYSDTLPKKIDIWF